MNTRGRQRGGTEIEGTELDNDDVFGRPNPERRRDNAGLVVAISGLALTFLIQFGGSIWWGATLSSDLRHVTETLTRLEIERYTKSDASRDLQRLDQRDAAFAESMTELRSRITRMEALSPAPTIGRRP